TTTRTWIVDKSKGGKWVNLSAGQAITVITPGMPTSCFYWAVVNADLPSFPTRRSSDLSQIRERHPALLLALLLGALRGAAVVERSEEHTSELQSRENLVCRLLLEKKKPRHAQLPWMRPNTALRSISLPPTHSPPPSPPS